MQITYFFDVCSMWCALGDEVIAEVGRKYGANVEITWIGDTPVFSGIYRSEPIVAALEAMLRDEEKYREHASSHPPIPIA